jgi:lactate dehydrogenase-like 2-hydroxyacid dehydrogenase
MTVGLDVYEKGKTSSLATTLLKNGDHLYTILRSPNVLITGHQGFFDQRSIRGIAHHHCEF